MAHLPRMDWNFKDELRQVDLAGGGEAFYVYDAGGQRVRKVVEKNSGALVEERIYLGSFEILRKRQNGTVTLERETLHVMDDKQRVALVERKTIDTQSPVPSPQSLLRYQLSNHLGSASLELDDAGQIISYEEYYPYGSTSYQAGGSAAEVSLKRYRYTGMERDEETGLNYHGVRYYAMWLGRWVSCDPIAIISELNLYAYVAANPLKYHDPRGRDKKNAQDILNTINRVIDRDKDKIISFEEYGAFSRATTCKIDHCTVDTAAPNIYDLWVDYTVAYGSGQFQLDSLVQKVVDHWAKVSGGPPQASFNRPGPGPYLPYKIQTKSLSIR